MKIKQNEQKKKRNRRQINFFLLFFIACAQFLKVVSRQKTVKKYIKCIHLHYVLKCFMALAHLRDTQQQFEVKEQKRQSISLVSEKNCIHHVFMFHFCFGRNRFSHTRHNFFTAAS